MRWAGRHAVTTRCVGRERVAEEARVEPERVSALATFMLAAIRGLQLDLLATGERARIDAAFRELLGLLSLRGGGQAADTLIIAPVQQSVHKTTTRLS